MYRPHPSHQYTHPNTPAFHTTLHTLLTPIAFNTPSYNPHPVPSIRPSTTFTPSTYSQLSHILVRIQFTYIGTSALFIYFARSIMFVCMYFLCTSCVLPCINTTDARHVLQAMLHTKAIPPLTHHIHIAYPSRGTFTCTDIIHNSAYIGIPAVVRPSSSMHK